METREIAEKLRSEGKTYRQITDAVGIAIPKSTLSYWFRDIKLSERQKRKIERKKLKHLEKIRIVALASNKEKRANYLDAIKARNHHLPKLLKRDTCIMLLSMLYLGEGSKWKSYRSLSLGSSDSDLIQTYLFLLRFCYKINENRLRCRVMYRADQNLKKLEKYWAHVTNIPLAQFYKTKPDPRTLGKITTKKNYNGVCSIYYGSTEIQLELEIIAKIIQKEGPWYSGNTRPWHG